MEVAVSNLYAFFILYLVVVRAVFKVSGFDLEIVSHIKADSPNDVSFRNVLGLWSRF